MSEAGSGTSAVTVSVVIPVYRNRDTLSSLHARLSEVLPALASSYEVVFVDDGCPQGSAEVLGALARADQHVRVYSLSSNAGQQRAVLAGLARAQGSTVVVMDADLQDPPEAIPALVGALEEPMAAVFMGRRGRHQPPIRQATSRAFKALLHRLTGTPADAGLFVAMTRQMVDRLVEFDPPGPSVLAMIGCTGLPVSSIPLGRAARPVGRSAYTSWRRVSLSVRVLAWVLAWKWRAAIDR